MHALVTGASAGIGEAITKHLAAAGYDLTLVARRGAELERVISELPAGVNARAMVVDVTDLDALVEHLAAAEGALGPLDLLVNNAGVQIVAALADVDVVAGERLLTINVRAPLRLAMAAVPGMVARGRGTIVNIASLAALAPTPGMVHYSASKAALAAASEALRPELRRAGVNVVTVYPGPVRTAMATAAIDRYASDPTRGLPVGTTEVLARRIVRAIERRRARVIYPAAYWSAWVFPTITTWVLDRFSPIPASGR